MRILFMGTPDLAAESLGALIAAGHEIVGVFTRADKPVGRKQVLTAPPVKQLAGQHGIPVWQPATLRDGEAEKVFRALQPDLVVVVAYGIMISTLGGAYYAIDYYFDSTTPTRAMQDASASMAGFLLGENALLFWGGAVLVGTVAPLILGFLATKKAKE